jgi:hypothetical protein
MSDNPSVQGVLEIVLRGDREAAAGLQRVRTEAERVLKLSDNTRRDIRAIGETAKQSPLLGRDSFASAAKGADELSKRLKVIRTGYGDLRKELLLLDTEAAKSAAARKVADLREEVSARAAGTVRKGLFDSAQLAAQGNVKGAANVAVNTAQAAAANASLTSVVGAFGLIGGAAIAVAVASRQFFQILDQGKAAVTAAANSQRLYYETLTEGTTTSIQDQIKAQETQKSVTDQTIRDLENARNIAAQSGGVFGDFLVRVGDLTGYMGGVSADEIQRLKDESLQLQFNINALNSAMQSSEVSANDLKIAEEKLAEERKKLNDFLVSDSIRAATVELDYRRQFNSYSKQSADQLRDSAAALQQQITDQEAYIAMLETTTGNNEQLAQAMNAAADQLAVLKDLHTAVTGTLLQNALAEERRLKVIKDSTSAIEEATQIRQSISDLQKQQSEVLEERRRADDRNAQVKALQDRIATAKAVEAEQERTARLAKLRADAVKQEGADRAKLNTNVKKLNDNFFANELKAHAEFRLSEQRINDKAALERVRKLQDLEDELSDLAAGGDVVAFIRAQRQGLKDINRTDEDQGVERRQRLEDFQLQRQEAADARNAQVRDLLASFEEDRRVRQQENAERINQEIAAGKTRVTQSALLEQQLADLREQFAADDLARTRQREDDATRTQLEALRKRQAELAPQIAKGADLLANSAVKFLDQVSGGVVSMINRIRNATTAQTQSKGTPPKLKGGIPLNFEGGIYTQPTIGALAETNGYGDMVIPFRQSEGFYPALERAMRTAGGGGGRAATFTFNYTVGDVATETRLREVQHQIVEDVVRTQQEAQHILQRGA